jgi:hypothetical protein
MTLAIYTPARGRHHVTRTSLLRRIKAWLFDETPVGATDTLPVIDAVVVDDPLDPHWSTYEPDKERALIGDALSVETPVVLDRGRVPWLDEWTSYWRTIPVTDDDQKALPAGSAS